MTKPISKRRAYRSKKTLKAAFDVVASDVTQKLSILVGIERVGGYCDNTGTYNEPAYCLHVDGLAFRVESYTHAIAFLRGFESGIDFLASSAGHGCVTPSECKAIVRQMLEERKEKK